MMSKNHKVLLQLKSNEETAKEVAYEVLRRANPHDSSLVEQKLIDADVTLTNLTKYFVQLQTIVSQFWAGVDDVTKKSTLAPHEIRSLYLPMMYSVIFSSVGNMKSGNYEYVLTAIDGDIVDKSWVIDFSVKLETVRMYIKGDTGQIGNRNALPQTSVMMTTLCEVVGREAQLQVRDGQNYDIALSGFAGLIGLSLVSIADDNLYTGVENVNFRQLVSTIKESASPTT